jgi:hypothetical protein
MFVNKEMLMSLMCVCCAVEFYGGGAFDFIFILTVVSRLLLLVR